MKLKIITKQLIENLSEEHDFKDYKTIDPTNFNEIFDLFNEFKPNALSVLDATMSNQIKKNHTIQVMDHINKTGTNILIGKQKKLGIDFVDLNNLYFHESNSVITKCCGYKLDRNIEYPSYFLCHITVLAKAM